MFIKKINKNKKGFTLVELLIVVAILGILAAVGIVSFGGFLGSAKIKATQANHKNIVNFMNAKITQCSLQERIDLVNENGDARSPECKDLGENDFVNHFRGSGFKNPYGSTDSGNAVNNSSSCGDVLGRTDITKNGDEYYQITTYYEDGVACLSARITIE